MKTSNLETIRNVLFLSEIPIMLFYRSTKESQHEVIPVLQNLKILKTLIKNLSVVFISLEKLKNGFGQGTGSEFITYPKFAVYLTNFL